MAATGSLPAANIYSTWVESVEVLSILDDTPYDLSAITEITLGLQSPSLGSGPAPGFFELKLTLSNGDIVVPAPGIIQWRAERGAMSTMRGGLYEMILVIEDETDSLTLVLGTVSIVE